MTMLQEIRNKRAFICDMDGVIYHGRKVLPGAKPFVNWLRKNEKPFLFLTNSAERTPQQLSDRLAAMGIAVGPDHFMTSAIATASFLQNQSPGAKVFAIGENGLLEALEEGGMQFDSEDPDYVVFGETTDYTYDKIETAIRCVLRGARLIGTNPDITGPGEKGIVPACRALIAPIELSTGRQAYFIGKPNPLIMRHSLKKLNVRREETVIVGDRMDTDIIAGIESEIETVLVLSGITRKEDIERYAYRPSLVLDHVGQIAESR
ncbi:MAG: HAD family hydrolase [Sedimentisphaerales bacterium]|nr:HAD family hydrolase [Sedimentisphaerales bacterium]